MYKPLNPTSKSDDGAEKKPKKWPDRLGRTPNQTFDSEGSWPRSKTKPSVGGQFLTLSIRLWLSCATCGVMSSRSIGEIMGAMMAGIGRNAFLGSCL